MTRAVATRVVRNDTNQSYFDLRPMTVGGFRFLGRGVVPVGRPTLEGYAAAFRLASDAHEGSPYWVADLVAYGDSRADWQERLSQAQAVTGLSIDRLHDLGYVGRRTSPTARLMAPSIEHARAVAKLPDELDRLKWLRKAREGGWSVLDLRHAITRHARSLVIDGQADTMHEVEVTVLLAIEAPNTTIAQDRAWAGVKAALGGVPHAQVIAARVRPR